MYRSILLASLLAIGCATDDVDQSAFAIDTDGSGAVDCADLDHVLTCIHHPDAHACAHADVNGDGTIDDADVHDLHAALAGHHCAEPEHHHTADHDHPVP